jgi:GPI mannosyltransferase 3
MKTPWLHIVVVAAIAAADAVLRLGRIHPDEVYQLLEPAVHKLYGYGILAWEWDAAQGGIRNWAFPGIVMGCLKLADALGIADPQGRRALVEVPVFLLHVAMLAAVFRFSARRVGQKLGTVCVWLVGLYAPVLWFGGRTTTETLSVAFLVIALERLDARLGWREALIAGVCLGLAQIFRYGSAAAIVFVLLVLLGQRRWQDFAAVCLGGAVMAAALAALDFSTWGFLSLQRYIDFNVTSGRAAAQFGASEWWWYGPRLLFAPWAVVGLLAWWKWREGRAWAFVIVALGYMAAISATAHKEARFLYPTLVLVTVAATPAAVRWLADGWRSAPRLLVGVACLAATVALWAIPGPFTPERPEQFQLTVKAARDGKGLLVVNEGVWGAGGFFYLGKNMPWCTCDFPQDGCFQMALACKGEGQPPQCPGTFDRALIWDGRGQAELEAAGFSVVERRGYATLLGRR